MLLLSLKMALAPLLVLAGTLAQRRFGPAVGGRLVSLPLTSLPLLLILCVTDGKAFAGTAAGASLAAGVAQSGWCVAYAVAARRRGPASALVIATGVFAASCVLLDRFPAAPAVSALLAGGSVLVALRFWPVGDRPLGDSAPRRFELPARMAAAAAFTFAVSESASALGARPAGLLGALPVLTVVLSVGTHHASGSVDCGRFLEGVMEGSLSVVAAIAVLSMLLDPVGPLVAFPLAVLTALAAQAVPAGRLARIGKTVVTPDLACLSGLLIW